MVDNYLPLAVVLGCGVALAAIMLLLSSFLGPRRPSDIKMSPFECGNPTHGAVLDRFNVRFYLVAILFLVFDIEAVFIYPWAILLRDSAQGGGGASGLSPLTLALEMASFVTILLVGLAYAWRKGALLWSKERL